MAIQKDDISLKKLIFVTFIFSLLFLQACNSDAKISPNVVQNQQAKSINPDAESDSIGKNEITPTDEIEPSTFQESRETEIIETYPSETPHEQVTETPVQNDIVTPTTIASPTPTEEPKQDLPPTPRGNDLVATDPSSFKLASGQLQLVELFAFW